MAHGQRQLVLERHRVVLTFGPRGCVWVQKGIMPMPRRLGTQSGRVCGSEQADTAGCGPLRRIRAMSNASARRILLRACRRAALWAWLAPPAPRGPRLRLRCPDPARQGTAAAWWVASDVLALDCDTDSSRDRPLCLHAARWAATWRFRLTRPASVWTVQTPRLPASGEDIGPISDFDGTRLTDVV